MPSGRRPLRMPRPLSRTAKPAGARRGGTRSGGVRDQRDQLVQRRHLATGEDVGASGRRRMLAAQSKAFDKIVDVGQMVIDFAAAQCRKAPDRVPEQLQEPSIAWTVDAARPGQW